MSVICKDLRGLDALEGTLAKGQSWVIEFCKHHSNASNQDRDQANHNINASKVNV